MDHPLRIALYGENGHQIGRKALANAGALIVAAAKISEERLSEIEKEQKTEVRRYRSLAEMLTDPALDLVSVCSPNRSEQYEDLKAILSAKKHAYAEKPTVFAESELDELLALASENGVELHEYSDTVFAEPFRAFAKAVRSGRIGTPVQVFVQKSYPYAKGRRDPNDDRDGGIIRWVGIHAIKMAEQATGLMVEKVYAVKGQARNDPECEGLYNNATLCFSMTGGASGAAVLNYFKPEGFPLWGNETLRVFGTKGFAEVTDGGLHSRIYTDRDEGELISDPTPRDDFDFLVDHLTKGDPYPLTPEEEFHPLRVVIRAENDAKAKL